MNANASVMSANAHDDWVFPWLMGMQVKPRMHV